MATTVSSSRFGLPVLVKELVEQAARRRTYIIRVVYALLLFGTSFVMFEEVLLPSGSNVWSLLGKGRELYERMLGLQFFGVFLFMPAITSGVLTQEKERDSLTLLLLTRLDPWTIVLEKLLSRLVPMLCFLMLSLPLLAIAYSLGGITPAYFWGGLWMLLLTAFQTGSLAVACSAYFRTTVGAFIGTYLIGFALIFGPALMIILGAVLTGANGPPALWNWPGIQNLMQLGLIDHPEQIMLPFFAPAQIMSAPFTGRPLNFWMLILRGLPLIVWTWFFLSLARRFVVSRAFARPWNPLLAMWRRMDRFFQRLNQNRVTRGVVLIRDNSGLPEDRPIVWRETTKRSLGRSRYLLRLLLVVETVIGVLLFCNAIIAPEVHLPMSALAMALLASLIALLVTVVAASLFSGERTHQTLDVLCATPLASRDIIEQKFAGVSRLINVLTVPLLTVVIFEVFWKGSFPGHKDSWSHSEINLPLYLVSSLLTVFIYPRVCAWMGCWIGLWCGKSYRAIVTALLILVAWCFAPLLFVLGPLMMSNPNLSRTPSAFLALLSPLTVPARAQFDELNWFFGLPWLAVILNALLTGAVALVFRTLCLWDAARLLGRSETKEAPSGDSDPLREVEPVAVSASSATPVP